MNHEETVATLLKEIPAQVVTPDASQLRAELARRHRNRSAAGIAVVALPALLFAGVYINNASAPSEISTTANANDPTGQVTDDADPPQDTTITQSTEDLGPPAPSSGLTIEPATTLSGGAVQIVETDSSSLGAYFTLDRWDGEQWVPEIDLLIVRGSEVKFVPLGSPPIDREDFELEVPIAVSTPPESAPGHYRICADFGNAVRGSNVCGGLEIAETE